MIGERSNDILVGALPGGGKSLNCHDEVCPGSRDRMRKFHELKHEKVKVDENFTKNWARLITEMGDIMVKEHMGIAGCSEVQAKHFIGRTFDFNHVKVHECDDGMYISPDPILREETHDNL